MSAGASDAARELLWLEAFEGLLDGHHDLVKAQLQKMERDRASSRKRQEPLMRKNEHLADMLTHVYDEEYALPVEDDVFGGADNVDTEQLRETFGADLFPTPHAATYVGERPDWMPAEVQVLKEAVYIVATRLAETAELAREQTATDESLAGEADWAAWGGAAEAMTWGEVYERWLPKFSLDHWQQVAGLCRWQTGRRSDRHPRPWRGALECALEWYTEVSDEIDPELASKSMAFWYSWAPGHRDAPLAETRKVFNEEREGKQNNLPDAAFISRLASAEVTLIVGCFDEGSAFVPEGLAESDRAELLALAATEGHHPHDWDRVISNWRSRDPSGRARFYSEELVSCILGRVGWDGAMHFSRSQRRPPRKVRAGPCAPVLSEAEKMRLAVVDAACGDGHPASKATGQSFVEKLGAFYMGRNVAPEAVRDALGNRKKRARDDEPPLPLKERRQLLLQQQQQQRQLNLKHKKMKKGVTDAVRAVGLELRTSLADADARQPCDRESLPTAAALEADASIADHVKRHDINPSVFAASKGLLTKTPAAVLKCLPDAKLEDDSPAATPLRSVTPSRLAVPPIGPTPSVDATEESRAALGRLCRQLCGAEPEDRNFVEVFNRAAEDDAARLDGDPSNRRLLARAAADPNCLLLLSAVTGAFGRVATSAANAAATRQLI
ncbi:hypothetical protein DIPPA_26430 [Diplonema papillatum]|nr:hypothetical protein DIPPA_26430 [Diplonema papillatum]